MWTRLGDRWPVILMPLLFWALDTVLTYGRQPPRAVRTAANVFEMNPVAAQAFVSGFGAEVLLLATWILVIAVPVLLLPQFWAICYSYGWGFGHAAGGLVWLVYPFGYRLGYWTLYWYCPVVALIFTWVARQMFLTPLAPVSPGENAEQSAPSNRPRD